jgi:prepilin-type N-terminal cleavage/methylation domain-containing protein
MKKNAFTLVELIAVIVILGVILAIAVPSITGVINKSTKASFESDAKLILKAMDYKTLENASFNPTTVNEENITNLLGLSNANYSDIKIVNKEDTLIVTISGKGKWAGLVACGTYQNMSVYNSTSECSTDLIPPVITITGDNPVNIFINSTYIDEGATAIDDKDGDLTSKIVTIGTVNPSIPGSYNITYSGSDAVGNTRTVVRTVNVIDNVGPNITLSPNGSSTYGKKWITIINVADAGGIDISSLKYLWSTEVTEPSNDLFTLSYTNNQSITTPITSGSYYLWVKATDSASNQTVIQSNVFNLDNESPVITLNGNSSVTINKGSTYIDAGASAIDNIDTNVIVTSTGSVNHSL